MPSSVLIQTAVWALTVLVLVSALLVVSLSNLFRAALSLGLVLVGVAGLFVLLEAEFLAFAQILVYVGAILTLVVFAVMLTARAHADAVTVTTRQRFPAAMVTAALFLLLAFTSRVATHALQSPPPPVSLVQLGNELVGTLVLPFEVISVVFVAAMVGAIAIASSKTRSPHASE